jgi:D-alanyl-D-alanine carboxypeptidase
VGTGSWPVRPSTPFVIGSITKTFVAATILQLAEEGVLSLGDPLSRWLPEHPRGAAITLRQLLAHTSGEADYFDSPSYESLVFGRPGHVWSTEEILDLVGAPRFAPGTDWDYSNTNFVLLGLVAEAASGEPIGRAIERRFLEPLGMKGTTFQGVDAVPADAAQGYLRSDGSWIGLADGSGLRPNTSAATVAWAAGAMVSTPRDLATWARALYGGRVLSAASLGQMVTFNDDDYGLGTQRTWVGGREAWGHSGSLRGFEAVMRYVPSLDAVIVVVINRGRVERAGPIGRELGAIAFSHIYPDTTAPVVGTPTVALRWDAIVERGRVPVRARWTAEDGESGIAKLEALTRIDDGAWTPVVPKAGRRPSLELDLATGHTYSFALRATDAEGNTSPWVQTPLLRPKLISDASIRLVRDPSWRTGFPSTALGGSVAYTRTAGASAGLSFEALAVGWVAARSPRRGAAVIVVDGVDERSVDLVAGELQPRRLVATRAWSEAAAHTFHIRASGTVDRPRVDIDALALLTVVAGSAPPP